MKKMPMMKCGHTAQAIDMKTKEPCCATCSGTPDAKIIDDNPPNLTGRLARCTYCGRTVPSSIDLAFFEARGENTKCGRVQCHICGYHSKYWKPNPKNGKICYHNSDKPNPNVCFNMGKQCVFGAFEFDLYYCGCRGWD